MTDFYEIQRKIGTPSLRMCYPMICRPPRSRLIFALLVAATASMPPAQSAQSASTPTTPSVPYQWSNVAMGGTGFVSGLLFHPRQKNLFYARTDVGGAYRFDSSKAAWLPLLDWLPPSNASAMGIESIALDPRDPSKVYLLVGTPYWSGGTSILRSSNQGNTWLTTDVSKHIRAHGNKWGRHTGERLAVDPNHGSILFCGSRNNGLWKSTDSGATWQQVESFAPGPPIHRKGSPHPEHSATTENGNGICFVIFDPTTGQPSQATQTLYLGLSRPFSGNFTRPDESSAPLPNGNLFRSQDGGLTWNALPPLPDSPPPSQRNAHPCRAVISQNQLIVTFQAEESEGGGVFRFDPTANQWSDITPITGNHSKRFHTSFGGIDLVPGQPDRLLVSTFGVYRPQKNLAGKTIWGESIFFSTAGIRETGTTWINLFGNDKARLDPHTAFSKNKDIHWGASVALDPFDARRAFITSGNGIWATPNLNDALSPDKETRSLWKFLVKGLEEAVPMDVASIPNGPLISVIWDYAGFTNENPAAYSPYGQFNVVGGLNVRLASVGSGRKAGVIRLNSNGNMAWSQDSGVSWTALENNLLAKAGTNAGIALSADAKVILYTPSDSKTYRNEDPARKWPASGWKEVLDLSGASSPVADPTDPSKFYSYRSTTGEILVSSDSGKSFKPAANVGYGASSTLRPAPGRSGDVWVAMRSGGIKRFLNGQVSHLPIHRCATLGFGCGRTTKDYPTLFIWGQPLPADPEGIYRSTDSGKSWVRVNDDLHQYGGLGNAGFIEGDMNVFGRVYQSTAGRGIPYGTPIR